MSWEVTADETFWGSVWAIHDGLLEAFNNSRSDEDEKRFNEDTLKFEKFYELLERFHDDGQIGLGTWFPAKVGDEPQEGFYRIQIEGDPFQALYKVRGKPIFSAKAIFALREPPTEEQLKLIKDRLAAARLSEGPGLLDF